MPQYIDLSLSSVPEKCRVEMEFCQLKNQMKYQLPPSLYEKGFSLPILYYIFVQKGFLLFFIQLIKRSTFFLVGYSSSYLKGYTCTTTLSLM